MLKEYSAQLAVVHTCTMTPYGAWPTHIKEIGCEGVERVFCAHDVVCHYAVVKAVIRLHVP
jgi:hypothetical protein